SVAPQVEEILGRPHLLHEASGNLRGVFFGPEGEVIRGHVQQWMNDGILSDALHIGGFHGDSIHSYLIRSGGNDYVVSATQLARAVSRAAPGTSLTYDHLLTCCSAQPGGAASLFARLRGRMVLAYDEPVGHNAFGRYIGEPANPLTGRPANPLPSQYM